MPSSTGSSQGFLSVWKLFFLFEIQDLSHFLCIFIFLLPFPTDLCGMAQRLKHLPAMRETWVQSLEKEMATHSSILAWRIPWMEEPGGLQSTGSQRVRHD